jgi:hypothetical protein
MVTKIKKIREAGAGRHTLGIKETATYISAFAFAENLPGLCPEGACLRSRFKTITSTRHT